MMKKSFIYTVLTLVFLFASERSIAQKQVLDTIQRTATIGYDVQGRQVSFKPETPALRQIAGAPKAFYTYFWEFGDGEYSFEENPTHTYAKQGEYTTRLSVTNNYDDGKPPTTRPDKVAINSNVNLDEDLIASQDDNHHLMSQHNGFRLQNNREPLVNEEMEFVISYGNKKTYTTNGKLYLFFNEKKYKDKNFELLDVRAYHNEQEVSEKAVATSEAIKPFNPFIRTSGLANITNIKSFRVDSLGTDLPLSLEDATSYYHDYKVWDVDDIEPNEARNLFFTFKTTPEMLKDTTAVITIRSIYVPERGQQEHQVLNKEMEIVTSHDPNKMAVYNTSLNYRLVRKKRLKYKVRFQNDGEGPARMVKLEVDIPEMLDKKSLKLLDTYPKVPICPDGQEVRYSCIDTLFSKDQIAFQFKNIYLPGTAQKGVSEKDSTKGFVKYSLKFGKNFHKKRSKSQTAIIFDKNEPIITNVSTSRFKPGISIGAKAGYNIFPDLDNSKSYFIGATISPYKSYKKYWQSEIMLSKHTYDQTTVLEGREEFTYNSTVGVVYERVLIEETRKNMYEKLNFDLVPISFRYNLNNVVGLGVGVQTTIALNTKIDTENARTVTELDLNTGTVVGVVTSDSVATNTNTKEGLSFDNYGLFGDITVGASRIGPSFGARYNLNFKAPNSQIHLYAIWKF